MNKFLAAALTVAAAATTLGAAGTASADNTNLPTVVPLSGLLSPKPKPAQAAQMPPTNQLVENLLPHL
ncbi:hypothetical protein SLA_3139 [Streptomyces laurentii]|uniref:Secreted protein n=1 Tax=Streptomyces laurentii TaxID=39478 RepID=A0A160P139_STRLU|nr:hypothetical protein SLA_3139 [Streptomyces laurentii]